VTRALDWDEAYRSGSYRQFWELSHPSPELAAYLAVRAPGDGRTALDLGCGSGKDGVLLARSGYRVHGVDVSQEALEIARLHAAGEGVEVVWRKASVLDLPFTDGFFDLATDRGCLHHLPEEERGGYAREVGRILKPGGELLVRGCRLSRFPFFPVTQEALRRHFPPGLFALGPVLPLQLITDAGPLDGNICVIRKR
jgi:2-polyprenyl-3-methyl-5-hydroxy-6-metoxy-1,4-benzoquinol methylase